MAIFEMNIRGTDTVRLVKAATSAEARNHIVSAKAIGAERMSDLIESGVTLERAIVAVATETLVETVNVATTAALRDDGQPHEAPLMDTSERPSDVEGMVTRDGEVIVDPTLPPADTNSVAVKSARKGRSSEDLT